MSGHRIARKKIVGRRQLLRRVTQDKLRIIAEIKDSDNDSHNNRVNPDYASHITPTVSSPTLSKSSTSLPTALERRNIILCSSSDRDSDKSDVPLEHESNIVDSNPDSVSDVSDIPSQVRHWAIDYKVPHNAVNGILKIFSQVCPGLLPRDSRTLLNTPRQFDTFRLDSGEFVYIGVLKQLIIQLKLIQHTKFSQRELELSFNLDGLQIFKSLNGQVWPILGLIKNFNGSTPFAVAIFYGCSKPTPLNIYFEKFLKEIIELLTDGFEFEGIHYSIKIHSFICDAPARAFIKGVKQHGGYSACDKCVVSGKYVDGRVIYDSINATKRTDSQFRSQSDEDHHVGISPLLQLPIDMITTFPIEYMHLVCLGVMRKLLHTWISGALSVRLCSRSVNLISDNLLSCAKSIPIEFNRKPRGLVELSRWKATEFRMFLLYLGPMVLKDILPNALYKNYMLLHCAMTILCSETHIAKMGIELAHELLLMFISHCKCVYGLNFLIYNTHMLSHVCDDVRSFGVLDNYSAFPFENYLGYMKQLVRTPNKPLQQICKRLAEMELSYLQVSFDKENLSLPLLLFNFDFGPTPQHQSGYECFKKIQLKNFVICVFDYKKSDCYSLTKFNKVIEVHNIMRNVGDQQILLYCKEFMTYGAYFTYPFHSTALNIFTVSGLTNFKVIPVVDVVSKCIVMPTDNDLSVCFPIVHTL